MTTHVICLDGTDQWKHQHHPTNIARLFDSLGGTAEDAGNGAFEVDVGAARGIYLPGIGAPGSATLHVLGSLFGDGIAQLIVRGYAFLSRVYAPGDAVVVTGFSRGATSARALAGLITARGVLARSRYDVADEETAYRRAIAAWYAYRHDLPHLADQARLFLIGELTDTVPELAADDFTGPMTIDAVGVFDTVSSLGLPHLDESGVKFDFSICDTNLSARVTNGFHALAADETRELLAPTLWAARERVEQVIFPGSHGDVGGGCAERGLSDAALAWMIERLNSTVPAAAGGRLFDGGCVPGGIQPDGMGVIHDGARILPWLMTPSRGRRFPREAVASPILTERCGKASTIVPGFVCKPYAPHGHYADGSALVALVADGTSPTCAG